jgi:hypothetical protein
MKVGARTRLAAGLLTLLSVMWFTPSCLAQDLEPRRWTHLPVGLNVIGVGLSKAAGDILLDPVIRAEDVRFDLYATGLSYVHSFGLAGKTARIDVIAPYASGRWEGLVDGVYTSVRRRGLADTRVRFSMNLYGSPALKGKEYLEYRGRNQTHTTIGAAISLTMPTGDYNSQWLINLGSNRWVVRPQLGVLHQREKWQFELSGSILFFQDNDDFWQGTTRKQDPLWFLQGHVIYSFKPGLWTSLSAGFAQGGRSTIEDIPKADDYRNPYMAVSVGTALGKKQSLKLTYIRTRTNTSRGADRDIFALGWSYRWAN